MIENKDYPTKFLGELFYRNLERQCQDATAIVDSSTGETVTYGKLLQFSVKLAVAFKNLGLQRGSIIAIVAQNSWKYLATVISSFFIGTQLNAANPKLFPGELKHIFSISQPEVIICSKQVVQQILCLKENFSFLKHVIVIDDDYQSEQVLNFKKLLQNVNGNLDLFVRDVEPVTDVALVLSSSGTTGFPKCVLLTHTVFAESLRYFGDPQFGGMSKNERTIGYLPFFHVWGLQIALGSIINSTQLIVVPKFQPNTFLETLQKYQISMMFCVPPILVFLSTSPLVKSYNLAALKDMICAGAVIKEELIQSIRKRLNITSVRQAYGLTEVSGLVVMVPKNCPKRSSVGKPMFDVKIKVCDLATGQILPHNKIGEICIAGSTLMKGYHRNQDATIDAFDHDGFLKTGDLGYCDEENYYYIIDRIKDVIKYKAFQVSPSEIEYLLNEHPSIKDAGVVGIPDEKAGEVPLAFVVKEPNADITKEEIIKYVNENISAHKRLYGGVRFIDEIPRNVTGKILRRELRKLI